MKQNFFLLITLFTAFSNYSSPFPQPTEYERQTVLHCLQQASPDDARLLLNFLYVAYNRSKSCQKVHVQLLEILGRSWELWQNCSTTRINPSRELPFPAVRQLDASAANRAANNYFRWNTLYAAAAERLFKEEALQTKEAQLYAKELRITARQRAAQAAVTPLTQLTNHLTKEIPLPSEESASAEESTSGHHKGIFFDALDFIGQNFAVPAFAHTDTRLAKISSTAFETLLASQRAGSQLWEAIEGARSEWYGQQYLVLYQTMQKLNFPEGCFRSNFGSPSSLKADKLPADLPLSPT